MWSTLLRSAEKGDTYFVLPGGGGKPLSVKVVLEDHEKTLLESLPRHGRSLHQSISHRPHCQSLLLTEIILNYHNV